MCLAIFKPAGVKLPEEYYRNGFSANNDGAGFAVAFEGKIQIHKGFFKFKKFWKHFRFFQDRACVIHFRWATHGTKEKNNCHPFSLADGKFALVHNGIINIKPHGNTSDTATFANAVLNPLLKMGLHPGNPSLKFLVEETIGKGNKIAVLSEDGSATIYNEESGTWKDGAWFSNDGGFHEPIYSMADYEPTGDWKTTFDRHCWQKKNGTIDTWELRDTKTAEEEEEEIDLAYYRSMGIPDDEVAQFKRYDERHSNR